MDENVIPDGMSWDEYVETTTNGWVVVAVFERISSKGNREVFTLVTGPWKEKRLARNESANIRRHWKRDAHMYPRQELLQVGISPLWKGFRNGASTDD